MNGYYHKPNKFQLEIEKFNLTNIIGLLNFRLSAYQIIFFFIRGTKFLFVIRAEVFLVCAQFYVIRQNTRILFAEYLYAYM